MTSDEAKDMAADSHLWRLNNEPEERLPRVECAWCFELLRDGPEPISHGICCDCNVKHFGGITTPNGHEWETINEEYERESIPVSFNPFTSGIGWRERLYCRKQLRCVHCGAMKLGEWEVVRE